MLRVMKHRGPDDEGLFQEGHVNLGFVRLAVIDLTSAGHQPMLSRDGRFVLVFNGEIYNYLELKEELTSKGYVFVTKTDAEVVLASYAVWGEKCLHRFNGMWAMVIYDRYERLLVISRDRFGVKPFYYYLNDDRLVFASEIPPILSFLTERPKVNNTAIYDYLVYSRTDQNEKTFFSGINKLQHGSMMTFRLPASVSQAPEISRKKWYDLTANLKEPFSTPDDFKDTFISAIRLRLRSDVPIGVCLSGGLDSSSIAAVLLKEFRKRDLNTFSAVYGKGKTGDESEFIDLFRNEPLEMYFTTPTAESLYKDLSSFVRTISEPVPTPSPYAQYKVMELAQGKVVVTLDGQGADEELAGYHYFFGFFFKELLKKGRLKELSSELFYYLKTHQAFLGISSLAFFLLPNKFRKIFRERENQWLDDEFCEQNRGRSTFSGDLYSSRTLQESLLNHFEFKLEHLLKWEDRNSMHFSLEARVPFLDYRLVERSLTLPPDKLIYHGMTKQVLREAMKGTLPERIRMRRDKVGFGTPYVEWLRSKPFQEFIVKLIDSPEFASRGVITPSKARKLYLEHIKGKVNAARDIWKWINLELWHREFIDA